MKGNELDQQIFTDLSKFDNRDMKLPMTKGCFLYKAK